MNKKEIEAKRIKRNRKYREHYKKKVKENPNYNKDRYTDKNYAKKYKKVHKEEARKKINIRYKTDSKFREAEKVRSKKK